MGFYKEFQVDSYTKRFVNKIWCLDNSNSEESKLGNQLLPNGCFNIGVVTGKGINVHFPVKTYNISPGVYLCSQVTQKTSVDIEPFTKIIFIQLHPWTLSYFPQYDLTQFLNSIIKLQLTPLLPNFAGYFTSQEPEIILEITNRLGKELDAKWPEKNLLELICGKIETEALTLTEMVKNTHHSIRSIQLKFKKSTGLTLKQYQVIVTFRKSVDQINKSNEKTFFTLLAIENGYFDQAHYIKTFKKIVNLKPKDFRPEAFLLAFKK